MNSALGRNSKHALVGYSVRFDRNVGHSNRILYMTEGMLLNELMGDPGLTEYGVVVVDEVHERSVEVDLLLGFLRDLVAGKGEGARKRKEKSVGKLKVVVMSATADVEALRAFFEEGFNTDSNDTGTADEQRSDREDIITGIELANTDHKKDGTGQVDDLAQRSANPSSTTDGTRATDALSSQRDRGADQTNRVKDTQQLSQQQSNRGAKVNGHDGGPKPPNGPTRKTVATIKVEGRQFLVHVSYLPRPTQDLSEEALKCIFLVHRQEPLPGDILVFMTGQETIQGLQRNIEEYAPLLGRDVPKMLVLPIYSALSQAAQQRVFDPAPPRTRKIVLATNIAETSITVPGVRYVIDCGKEKRKHFRPRLGLESLLAKPISRSSAIQRQGRAGREAPGKCWRLYTEESYNILEAAKDPEILRCDLAPAVLKMKANGVGDVMSFPLLTPPKTESLARALLQLYQLDAFDDAGRITPVGLRLSRFPLAPSYARVILAAAAASTEGASLILPVLDVVACFTSDATIFPQHDTEEARDSAAAARASLIRRQGDHITLLATVRAYAAEQTDRKAWATQHVVGHRAMQSVMDIRKQLRQLCVSQKLLNTEDVKAYDAQGAAVVEEDVADGVMKCFLRGFRRNWARLMPDGSYRTAQGNHTVAIHPSSVLFGRKVEAVLYNEFVFTSKPYARGCGVVRADWIGDMLDGE